MSDELKPCPFCGGAARGLEKGLDYDGDFWVECSACGAQSVLHVDEYDAAAAWNTRPIEDKLQDRIDALEWLREVEKVYSSMREWHPDRRKKNEEASRRRDDAWAGLYNIYWSARAAVEVGNE